LKFLIGGDILCQDYLRENIIMQYHLKPHRWCKG